MSSDVLIEIRNVSKDYYSGKNRTHRAISDINIKILKGKMYVITGQSGAGKSTLLNVVAGLDTPTEGKILYENEDISGWDEDKLADFRQKNVGFIFQSWELIRTMTARENAESPLYPIKGMKMREIRTEAESLLKQVGLYDKMDNFPDELSGGEQQRVGIARALASKPKIVFADEPTGNVDPDNEGRIMRLLKNITRRGTSIIVVTHNKDLGKYADNTYRMSAGRLDDY